MAGTQDKNLVSAAKPTATGAVFVAEANKNLPADSKTALHASFKTLGYIGEDGISNSVEEDKESIKAMGGDTVLVVNSGREETFTFVLLQSMDPEVLKVAYGAANVSSTSELITVKHNAKDRDVLAWVFEVLLTGNKKKRIVVPSGQITDLGEVVYKDGEPIGYECTVTAFPDAQGNTAYEYIGAVA